MNPGPHCCPDGLLAPLERANAVRLASLIKAAADPARLQLLSIIGRSRESCVCDLQQALGLTQPTVSYHLKKLTEAGLISREQRGTWAWYRIDHTRMSELAAVFDLGRAPSPA